MWPWLLAFLIGVLACVLTVPLVLGELLGGTTGAERARDDVLETEAPQIVRDLEVANPDPGNLGPESVAWLSARFQRAGDTVLSSSSTPGRPANGRIDVRMIRTGEGTALGQPTGAETITICLRFEIGWSDTSGAETTVTEIDCP